MNNNTKYIIICEQADPDQPVSFEQFEQALQFLEEAGLMNAAVSEGPKKPAPDLDAFAEKLIELTDRAEEYRDMLDSFITEADALLEELDGMAGYEAEDE